MKSEFARTQLRQCLGAGVSTVVASVFDPLSARIANRLGYRTGILAGSVASLSVLGAPDLVLLTLSELVEQARRICRAEPGFPLIVDADHGYGNALNVRRTVADLEAAGVAGITIEDTALPSDGRSTGQSRLISMEAGMGKIAAALDARLDDETVIMARTSAVAFAGAQEAARRCREYARLGADAIFLSGVGSREDIEVVTREVDVPIVLGGLPRGFEVPGDLPVRLVLGGHGPFRKAMLALHAAMLEEARQHGVGNHEWNVEGAEGLLKELTLEEKYGIWRESYLR